MELVVTSQVDTKTASIKIGGELNSANVEVIKEAVEKSLAHLPANLVLNFEDLTFMSSAGLRVLIFAKQKLPDLKVFVVRPQQAIVDTLRKTGFYRSVYIVDIAPF